MDHTRLKAFAGHSFDEKDAILVGKILKFLGSAGVECESGESAENRSVSAKVRGRIDRNPIFVGIFTCRCKLNGQEVYSTSNWVIQESGYALGKGKELILLVENSIDNFPELQGDLEYIPFQRNSLADAFLKLNEIVGTIRTRLLQKVFLEVAQEPPKSVHPIQFPEEGRTETVRSEEVPQTPQSPEERKRVAVKRMVDAFILGKNFEKGQQIFREEAVPLMEEKERISWEGACLRISHELGDTDAFRRLEELVAANPKHEDAHRQLAVALESLKMWDKAVREYLSSAELESDPVDKCSDYGKAAIGMFMGGKINDAKELIEEKLQQFKEGKPAYHLLETLTDIADKEGDKESFVLYAERALELNPADYQLRFQAAYKYDELGKKNLSLYHYRVIETHKADGACLNNLGVVLSAIGIPCRSITSYKRAAEFKYTLAMANLAYKYLEAGFIDEALENINGAFRLAGEVDVHGNVGHAKTAVEEAKANENKREDAIILEAETEREFRLRYVEALYTRPPEPFDLSGKWHWGDWDGVMIKQSGALLEGSFEQSIPLGLLGLLTLSHLGKSSEASSTKSFKKQKVMIQGQIKNFTATIDITITEECERALPYLETPLKSKALVFFDIDGKHGKVYQESSDGKSRYYAIHKINNPA